jgi:hypothetical protein
MITRIIYIVINYAYSNMVSARGISVSAYCISTVMNYVFRIQHSDMSSFYGNSYQYVMYKLFIFLSMHYNIRTKLFVDIVAADYPQNVYRFLLSHNLFSLAYNIRLLFSLLVHNNSLLCSITSLFPAAN